MLSAKPSLIPFKMNKSPRASFEDGHDVRTTRRASDPPAAAQDLHARVEAWVNEGGAGGDVNGSGRSRLRGGRLAKPSAHQGASAAKRSAPSAGAGDRHPNRFRAKRRPT